MSCGLQSIERACGPVLVGLSQVQIIDPADVVSLPRRGRSGLYESDLVLKSGATIKSFTADPGTISFREEVGTTTAGDVYTQQVNWRARRDRAALVQFNELTRNRTVHLLITDRYSNQRLLLNMRRRRGQAENGPRGGSNAHTYTWSAQSKLPALFTNVTISNAPAEFTSAILRSPDGTYWRVNIGLCGELVLTTTTSTDTLPTDFRIADGDGTTYSLSVTNCGNLDTSASAGTTSILQLTNPGNVTYSVTIADNEVLITTPVTDIPGEDNMGDQNAGG